MLARPGHSFGSTRNTEYFQFSNHWGWIYSSRRRYRRRRRRNKSARRYCHISFPFLHSTTCSYIFAATAPHHSNSFVPSVFFLLQRHSFLSCRCRRAATAIAGVPAAVSLHGESTHHPPLPPPPSPSPPPVILTTKWVVRALEACSAAVGAQRNSQCTCGLILLGIPNLRGGGGDDIARAHSAAEGARNNSGEEELLILCRRRVWSRSRAGPFFRNNYVPLLVGCLNCCCSLSSYSSTLPQISLEYAKLHKRQGEMIAHHYAFCTSYWPGLPVSQVSCFFYLRGSLQVYGPSLCHLVLSKIDRSVRVVCVAKTRELAFSAFLRNFRETQTAGIIK